MVICLQVNITEPGLEMNRFVLLALQENDKAGSLKTYNFEDLLKSSDDIEYLNTKEYHICVSMLKNYSVPCITISSIPDSAQLVIINNVLEFIERCAVSFNTKDFSEEQFEQIFSVINKQFNNEELSILAIQSCVAYLKFNEQTSLSYPLAIPLELIDSETFQTVQEFLQINNNKLTSVFKSISADENKTLFQNECTDTLFIKLPNRVALEDDTISLDTFMPKREDVCIPYTDKRAYETDYKGKVSSSILPLIEGNSDNNSLPIQPNEEMFYHAVLEWIEFNMKEEYGIENVKIIDSLSSSFLTELIDKVYMWHWSHNPHVPLSIFEDEDSDENSISSRYKLRNDPNDNSSIILENGEKFVENAVILLNNFLEEASAVLGYQVYAQALVQICRWGTRKQTCIVFPEYDWVFSLGLNRKKNNIGSISDYETMKNEGGKEYSVGGIIYDNITFSCPDLNFDKLSMPIGLVIQKTLCNTKTQNKITLHTYISFIDFIKSLKASTLEVAGFDVTTDNQILIDDSIDFKGLTSFEVGELLDDYELNSDDMLQDPFFRSPEIYEAYLEYSVSGTSSIITPSQFQLVHERCQSPDLVEEIKKNQFSSFEELNKKISVMEILSPAAAIGYGIIHLLLKIYSEVMKEYDSNMSISQIIGIWSDAMSYVGYESELTYHNLAIVKKQESEMEQRDLSSEELKKENIESNPTLKSMTSFNTNNSITNGLKQEQPVQFIRSVSNEEKIIALYDSSNHVIGGFSIHKKKINNKEMNCFVLVDKSYMDTLAKERIIGSDVFFSILPFVFQSIFAISKGHAEAIQIYFNDSITIKYYRDYTNSVLIQMCEDAKKLKEE